MCGNVRGCAGTCVGNAKVRNEPNPPRVARNPLSFHGRLNSPAAKTTRGKGVTLSARVVSPSRGACPHREAVMRDAMVQGFFLPAVSVVTGVFFAVLAIIMLSGPRGA